MNHPDEQIVNENVVALSIKRQLVLTNLKDGVENHLINIAACVFVVTFLCIALAHGFSAKPFLGNSGMQIAANTAQNIFDFTYLVTAVGMVVVTLLGEKASVNFMQVIGKIYTLAALIGFMKLGSQSSSEWVSLTNLGLGMSLASVGSILRDYRHDLLVARLIAKERESIHYLNSRGNKRESYKYDSGKNKDTSDKEFHFEDSSGTNYRRGEFI